MAVYNVQSVLNVISNAKQAIMTATTYVQELKETGLVLSSESEAEVEAAIDELEAMLPTLRSKTKAKLLGDEPKS